MSSILYYSNFCEPSKKLLNVITKSSNVKNIHFICIDKRVKEGGKTYIILQNEQKILMPDNVTRVPALMLLQQNYKVIYGDDIYHYLKPQETQQIKQATQNNMVPTSFQEGFDTFSGFNIMSDSYSFLDQNDVELSTKGNGGMRQMHNYVSLNDSGNLTMHLPQDDGEYKNNKIKDGELSIEALQRKRNEELANLGFQTKPRI